MKSAKTLLVIASLLAGFSQFALSAPLDSTESLSVDQKADTFLAKYPQVDEVLVTQPEASAEDIKDAFDAVDFLLENGISSESLKASPIRLVCKKPHVAC